jgi:hypothetical protein
MLPSIRLIAATFFCGFVVVFAGLRVVASLNDIHEGLPVMAAHAAPIQAVPNADPNMRRGQSAAPTIYDLRFVSSSASYAPTLVSLAPTAPPLDITPPATGRVTKEELPAPAGSIIASTRNDQKSAASESHYQGSPAAVPSVESQTVAPAPATPSEP